MTNVSKKPSLLTTALAASRLSEVSGIDHHEIRLTLRTLGYLDVVPGLKDTLNLAASLRTRFSLLQEAFPNLNEIISRFLLAEQLAASLSQLEFTESIASRRRYQNLDGLLDAPAAGLTQPYDEVTKDFIAVTWLFRSLETLEMRPLTIFRALEVGAICMECNYGYWKGPPEISKGLLSSDFSTWADALSRTATDDRFKRFALFNRTISHLASIIPRPLSFPSVPPGKPAVALMEQRALSKAHLNFPSPSELQSLQEAMADLERRGRLSPLFYEKLVIGLGLATGQTIRDVLNMRVVGNENIPVAPDEQIIALNVASGFNGNYLRAEWIIPIPGNRPLMIPLPTRFTAALRLLVHFDTDAKLIERFPLTEQPWEKRCNTELMNLLGTGRLRSNLLLRDTLSRVCHYVSANPAMSYWLTAGRRGTDRPKRSAQIGLSYYLNPHSERTVDIFKAACKSLFGKFGSPGSKALPSGDFGVAQHVHRAAANFFRKRIMIASAPQDFISLHNAFAQYTLLHLIVATAHRKSTTPFFFPWDLNLEQRLAFIADKCLVGSEARFVPLAEVATAQIEAYFCHLRSLYFKLDEKHLAAKEQIARLIVLEPKYQKNTASQPLHPNAGLFFEIRSDGTPQTITTGQLDKLLKSAGIAATTGQFRKALADALWGKGISGLEIASLLGHSNDLHPFGPASSWSVSLWADKVRPFINEYLAERAWDLVESPLVHKNNRTNIPLALIPSATSGQCSYEGRAKERSHAETRAAAAIRKILSDDILEDHGYVIDDELLDTVRDEINRLLETDKDAKACATRMLAEALQTLRRRGTTIQSFLPNRYRLEPSPIELSFGRHLAIAKAFRNQFITRVGSAIGGPFDKLERIAQLAISLIVLDGVLDPNRINQVIKSLSHHSGITKYPDALTLRSNVVTSAYEYEWMTIASDITTALAMGLEAFPHEPDHTPCEKDVIGRISTICTKLLRRGAMERHRTLDQLAQIFKPWWFIHQAGAIYSTATGKHNGPAPHPTSEFSLIGECESPSILFSKLKPLNLNPETAIPMACGAAWEGIRCILQKSQGRTEEGTAHSRYQRQQLKESLDQSVTDDLAFWRQQQSIVDHLLVFTQSLLENGGLRLKKLRFSSIKTYLHTALGPLIKNAWDVDFSAMSVADYRALYQAVERECQEKRTDWHLVLRMFHLHLRNTIGAPYLPELQMNNARMRKRIRSSVITAAALDSATHLVADDASISEDQRSTAKALILTSVGYGGRLTECAGLKIGDFDSVQEKHLSIHPNVIRDLKSRTIGRVIPFPLLSPIQNRTITTQRKSAALSPDSEQFLFVSPKRNQKIVKLRPLSQSSIAAIRAASGNEFAVFHDLRRTFATKLVMIGIPLRSKHPALLRARERLLGPSPWDRDFALQITHTGSGNPFFIDGAAQVLGHLSPDTLLNVYFHGCALLLADTANIVNMDIDLDDGRLANMLGKDRTAIVKLRARRRKNQESTDFQSLTRHYLAKCITSGEAHDKKRKLEGNDSAERHNLKGLTLVLFDQLLCQRKSDGLSLEEMESNTLQLDIAPEQARRVIENYRQMVCITGFDDFEPDNSELFSEPPSRDRGLIRGSKERQAALQSIAELLTRNESFAQNFRSVVRCWLEYVDARAPKIICNNVESMNSTLNALSTIGARNQQLYLEAIGDTQTPLVAAALQKYSSARIYPSGRFSRGPAKMRVVEVAISIAQLSGSRIPDGRDFHRLLAVAACALG